MYVFYDLETTDTDPDFGQILQIGVIVTDDNFNITETHSLRARRQPWVIPSPEALLVTGITPEQLDDPQADSLFEVMLKFDGILKRTGATAIRAGYNIMRFDEPGIASAAHQNLLDDISVGAPRLDVIRMVHACLIHKPGALTLDEKTSKDHIRTNLGAVARQNGVALSEDDAHEAVNDVKATIGVAKVIKERAPDIWEQMMKMATAHGVADFVAANDIFCMSDLFYAKQRSRILTGVGGVAFDLSQDPAPYLNKTAEQIAEAMRDKNSAFVSLTREPQPILMPESMTPQNLWPQKIDRATLQARAAAIKADPGFAAKVAQAAALNVDNTVAPDIEKQIDEKVPAEVAPALAAWKKEFRAGDWPRRVALIDEFPTRFAEPLKTTPTLNRFVQFARRIVFDNAPELMDAHDRERYRAAIYARLTNSDPPEGLMTFPGARAEIALLHKELADGTSKTLKPGDEARIDALVPYYDALERQFAPAPPQNLPPLTAPGP
ncbi:MAG TPA: exonuclease domain-containing protein [Patescibacteria group bacterium]|nr:exonuclease domain-containing protein [Patescibacteria group bacterium]